MLFLLMMSTMFIIFITSMILVIFLLFSELFISLNFSLVNFPPVNMILSLSLDKSSLLFLLTVNLIFLMVLAYTLSYLGSKVYLKRFTLILSLFVLSMYLLILSDNLFSSLIGWDGLGTTSLFLILFYYSNSSFKAGTLTFLMNRFGDCMFIMTLTNILLMGETCFSSMVLNFPVEVTLLIIITSMTKSAQIPFSSWLPAAMEAPTPVSALVHSSTLVTAGIYMLYRYPTLWMSSDICSFLMISSLGTCFMAALSGLVENDFKKLIALSTLSQLGFIMFSISMGLLSPGFVHMTMHAFFKALLFLCAGYVIHSFNGNQKLNLMMLSKSQSPMLNTILVLSISSMMGFPFLSGFFSKDLVLDYFCSEDWKLVLYLILIMSFILTCSYSIRMVWYLMNSNSCVHMMSDDDMVMIKPMISLTLLGVMGGSLISWFSVDLNLSVNSSKSMIIMILMLSVITYWSFSRIGTSHFLESKWFLSLMNSKLSNSTFEISMSYVKSSDLQGMPGIMNYKLIKGLKQIGSSVDKIKSIYLCNLDIFMFVMLLCALTAMMNFP